MEELWKKKVASKEDGKRMDDKLSRKDAKEKAVAMEKTPADKTTMVRKKRRSSPPLEGRLSSKTRSLHVLSMARTRRRSLWSTKRSAHRARRRILITSRRQMVETWRRKMLMCLLQASCVLRERSGCPYCKLGFGGRLYVVEEEKEGDSASGWDYETS